MLRFLERKYAGDALMAGIKRLSHLFYDKHCGKVGEENA